MPNPKETEGNNSSGTSLDRIVDKLNSSPWAIFPPKLEAIYDLIEKRLAGENVAFEIDGDREDTTYLQINQDGIAVLQVMGTIGRRLNFIEKASGGVSTEILMRDIDRAIESPDVKAILLHIDSPGGTVDGTKELADYVALAKEAKPVFAYTDGMMASAAYWIGAAATKVFAYPTSQVGSIGVVAMHADLSVRDQKAGVKRTYIYNGKYKRLVSDVEPLSDEGKEYLQERVDAVYKIFVEDVARFRGVDAEHILKHESRIFLAQPAKEQGLIDDVLSFNQVYTQLRKEAKLMNYNELKTEHIDLFTQVKEEGLKEATANDIAENHADKVSTWKEEGMKAERVRISEVRESSFEGQEPLVDELIENGTSTDDARKKLIADQKVRVQGKLKEIEDTDTGDLGGGSGEEPVPAKAGEMAKTREEADKRLDELAKQLKEDEGISYSKAFKRVCRDNPELEKLYKGK